MIRRTLPLLLTAILMVTGFILPALRVSACLTSDSAMSSGCPMKAAASAEPIKVDESAKKHGCCIEKAPKPDAKVLSASCCCTLKTAAKPNICDYRTSVNVDDTAIAFEHHVALTGPTILDVPIAKRNFVDVRISRGPPRGAPPHRGPPTNA